MLTLYAASSNAGKLRDFAAAAKAWQPEIEIAALPGLAAIPAPEETGASFAQIAREKAMAYSRFAPGLLVLADDSGLEADALDGAPGVHSARYARDAGITDADVDASNNEYLLVQMRGVPPEQRTARYRCALAVARDGVCVAESDGVVEGVLLETPLGTGGFGYDPLFWLPERGATMAQIDLAEKQAFSHRGRALRRLLATLATAKATADSLRE
jgi:XTP/dITP diphosphohydrolase